jgi:hypothetical protein
VTDIEFKKKRNGEKLGSEVTFNIRNSIGKGFPRSLGFCVSF